MRSCLLASLASLAIPKVDSHPAFSGLSQDARMLTKRDFDLESFRMVLKTDYTNATSVKSDPSISRLTKRGDPQDTATELVKATVPGATFRLVNDHYVGQNGIGHYNFKQTANKLDIDNADFNVNIGRDGEVFSFGNSFYKGNAPSVLTKREDIVDPAGALKGVVAKLGLPVMADEATAEKKDDNTFTIKQTSGTVKEPEAKLCYVQTATGDLLLSYVDASSPERVHHVIDYAADATYQVYPWGVNDPTEGERVILRDPFDSKVSPFGWNNDGSQMYRTTRGNNAIAQSNWENKPEIDYMDLPRPISEDLRFEYPFSLNESDYKSYINASITQLFYTANKYHDLLYKLGFTEAAGNFEIDNNGKGGIGNDFVYLNAQDGAGMNNANFLTPPDGERARMRMYMWDEATPFRDASFDAGIVIHEHTHGVSNRLTGGPANEGCLNTLESVGMGEGWSDFFATAIRLKPNDTRAANYVVAAWLKNDPKGLRPFPYSTDMTANPILYTDVNEIVKTVPSQPHWIGNVWASMLYEILWNLIDKHGLNPSYDEPKFDEKGVPTDGKFLALKIVTDSFALQPCNPVFPSSRDAILDADKVLTGGQNACEIWKGFAKRGLGEGAKHDETNRTASTVVPNGVCS